MDEQAILLRLVESGLAHCAGVVRLHGGLLLSALTIGLTGSVTHCLGMCGPFVMAQVTARMETLPAGRMREADRVRNAALVSYHLGRITSYTMLGGLAGGLADGMTALTRLGWLPGVLLAIAAGFFVAYGGKGLIPAFGRSGTVAGERHGIARGFRSLIRPLLSAPVRWRGYGLGAIMGFLPCGMLYGMLILAGGAGGALAGAMALAVFALSTIPAQFAVGLLGQVATCRFRSAMTRIGRAVMVVNGLVLAAMAAERLF